VCFGVSSSRGCMSKGKPSYRDKMNSEDLTKYNESDVEDEEVVEGDTR